MGPTNALSQKDEVDTNDDNWGITLLKEDDQDFQIRALNAALALKISQSFPSNPIIAKALATMNDEKGEPWIP